MCKNQLIYLAFGSETYQVEAFFSIASAIARNLETPDFSFDIHVYTDAPDFYKKLPVQVHAIKNDWYGKINYHFRLKHAVVYENSFKYEKTILIDTDTFFKKSPKLLFDKITEKNLLCNSKHYSTLKELDLRVKKALIQEDLLKDNFVYLNSGVIGISHESVGILKKSIEIIDKLHPKLSFYYTLEELALALAVSLDDVESIDCVEVIHHYWSRKAIFRTKAEAWYNKHKDDPMSKSALDDTLKVTDKIPKPPTATRTLNKLLALSVHNKYRQFIKELLNANYQYKNEFDNAAAVAWIQKAFENLLFKNPDISNKEIEEILNKKQIKYRLKNILNSTANNINKKYLK